MQIDLPLVSVIIPVFNREQYLPETIESCLEQTDVNLEIIIVDDGSSDRSVTVANHYAAANSNITVLCSEQNKGQCYARNLGLSKAKGEYVKFLDSDDLLLPQAIKRQVDCALSFEADLCIGQCQGFWDEELKTIREKMTLMLQRNELADVSQHSILESIKQYNFTFNEVLLKRELLLKVGGFDASLRAAEELNLLLKLATEFPNLKAVIQSDVLILKRFSNFSLASIARSQKEVPHVLVSLQKAGEYYLAHEAENLPLKQYVFNRLYTAAIYAHRNGIEYYSKAALSVWKRGKIEPPNLSPWYHNYLHKLVGFEASEFLLSTARNLVYSANLKGSES